MAREWRIVKVLQQGFLSGSAAGRTHKFIVEFPWGEDLFECAPNFTAEDIANTLDSRVREGERREANAVIDVTSLLGLEG